MFYQLLKPYIKSVSHMSFNKGEIIYHEGDIPDKLYLVDDGIVGLFNISENGKETFLRVFNKNSIFGHRSHFAGTPYHATTIALVDTKISVITKDQCEEICSGHPNLLKEMTKHLAKDLGNAELRLAGLLDKSANKRIVEALVYFKLKHPQKVWTRKEIAEYSGSTYESVARVMSTLANENLIKKDKRDFEIIDIQTLLDFSEDNF